MSADISSNTPTLKRSFVEKFIAPASSLAGVFSVTPTRTG